MDVKELIRKDLEEIYIGNLNTVDQDLRLPGKGRHGTVFSWSSGEERFITGEGKVTRPLYGMGNRKVLLCCRASYEGEQGERSFEATVLQAEKQNRIRELLPVKIEAEAGEISGGGEQKGGDRPSLLPSVVIALCEDGRYITLPVHWTEEKQENTERKTGNREGKEGTEGKAVPEPVRYIGTAEGTDLKAQAEIRTASVPGCSAACDRLPASPKATREPLQYFPVEQIRLRSGSEFYTFQQRMNEFLLSADDDSMLFNFREAAGLETKFAKPMTGWDARECKLRGHTTGHYLSGLALAYAATGKETFRGKAAYMVTELARCRRAFGKSGRVKPGYFGAFDEEQFDLLEKLTPYPQIWAPYYTLEKMMSGLYDVHTLTGDPLALDLLTGLGGWTCDRLSRLPEEKRKKMWSMYIAGEFGGMIGILAKLSGLTGEEKYRKAAEYFYNDKLFYPMEQGIDVLEDMHANQHIPQIMGAMELYRNTGEEKYYRIGRNFWEIVTGHHCYRTGGTGETEMFHGRDCEAAYLTEKTAESCAGYNLLRLTGQLFACGPDGAYMDYYENTLLNHLLATAAKDASGGTVYFLPLCPGGRKEYSTEENSCCHGTGLESRYRFMENIYARDDEYIYVNLYVPSELKNLLNVSDAGNGEITVTALKDLRIPQKRKAPGSPEASENPEAPENREKKLALRIPSWAGAKFRCSLPGEWKRGYFFLKEVLHAGETVSLQFPMEEREIPVPGSSLKCLAEGPYLLAAVSESRSYMKLKQARTGQRWKRLNAVDGEAYHVYFR